MSEIKHISIPIPPDFEESFNIPIIWVPVPAHWDELFDMTANPEKPKTVEEKVSDILLPK